MAFCNAALVANLVASIMVSGVCCIHSMHEEEERKKEHKETLKEAISMEWERQRQKDREHRERIVKEARIEAGARLAEERRRYLIYAKTRATTQAFSATRKRSRAGSGSTGNKSTRTTRLVKKYRATVFELSEGFDLTHYMHHGIIPRAAHQVISCFHLLFKIKDMTRKCLLFLMIMTTTKASRRLFFCDWLFYLYELFIKVISGELLLASLYITPTK